MYSNTQRPHFFRSISLSLSLSLFSFSVFLCLCPFLDRKQRRQRDKRQRDREKENIRRSAYKIVSWLRFLFIVPSSEINRINTRKYNTKKRSHPGKYDKNTKKETQTFEAITNTKQRKRRNKILKKRKNRIKKQKKRRTQRQTTNKKRRKYKCPSS